LRTDFTVFSVFPRENVLIHPGRETPTVPNPKSEAPNPECRFLSVHPELVEGLDCHLSPNAWILTTGYFCSLLSTGTCLTFGHLDFVWNLTFGI